jgi:hypothetical protein
MRFSVISFLFIAFISSAIYPQQNNIISHPGNKFVTQTKLKEISKSYLNYLEHSPYDFKTNLNLGVIYLQIVEFDSAYLSKSLGVLNKVIELNDENNYLASCSLLDSIGRYYYNFAVGYSIASRQQNSKLAGIIAIW